MHFEQNLIYHVYNQGNNKQAIFFNRDNYLFFLKKMRKHLLPYANLLCYCLMPNHFHWLLIPKTNGLLDGTMPRFKKMSTPLKVSDISQNPKQRRLNQEIGILLSGYTKAINKQQERSGSLFRPKTKAKNGWIDEFVTLDSPHKDLLFKPENNYAWQCYNYIHKNPVKAGLVDIETDWEFSSAKDYAGLRNGTLCNKSLATEILE